MPENSNRNLFMFMVLAVAILMGYEFLYLQPQNKRQEAELAAKAQLLPKTAAPSVPGAPGAVVPVARLSRAQALAATPRAPIDTPALTGSISLKGARFDDLHLKGFKQTLDKPDLVEILRPEGVEFAHFAEFSWLGANIPALPNRDTMWTVAAGSTLTPATPVVLSYDNGAGLSFTRTISVDDKYVFTIADAVTNSTAAPVQLAPYASVQRQGYPEEVGRNPIVHEGGIGVLGTEKHELVAPKDLKYPKWKKEGKDIALESRSGWLGLTDKYWMTVLIPDQAELLKAQFRSTPAGENTIFDANYVGQSRTIAPGAQATETTHFFAGAKTVPVLQAYEKSLDVPRFDDAVDWGMFWFFTKPIFMVLEFFFRQVGNFGVAILGLTVLVKLIFFPLANKSYESITKMKKVQPLMEELKKKYPNDPAKMQQETMALYQREKINPLSGCLPILIQIPVFYSLYKVLSVTIEMRQAPFFGWLRDLSARDPTTIWNLFGALPFDPAHYALVGPLLDGTLHLSALAIIYGFSMWLSQAMNPPATDPTQRLMFQLMPVILTITLATVASGLLVYWIWNNLLTILQQYFIMHRFKVENPIDTIIAKVQGKPPPFKP